jgi:hypothetical protein
MFKNPWRNPLSQKQQEANRDIINQLAQRMVWTWCDVEDPDGYDKGAVDTIGYTTAEPKDHNLFNTFIATKMDVHLFKPLLKKDDGTPELRAERRMCQVHFALTVRAVHSTPWLSITWLTFGADGA